MKAVVFTLGCKVNEVESASVMAALEASGWEVSDKLGYADVFVLNTCAVTREAEKKSRQLIARAKKFNPAAQIYVCGCASFKNKSAFEDKGVACVFGTGDKSELIKMITGQIAPRIYPKQNKTRAFVKIQDGCNNFCSYCIIPYLRGREKSRSVEDILGEIERCPCKEVVLTGINISSYNDNGRGLAELITSLKGTKKRIRLGSLECMVIDKKLLGALKELYDFAPQFHLSLQSGSNAVLKSMNRHYTREQFLEKCALIYSYFPECSITTDIISGYPTETEEDFQSSLSLISEAGFGRVHAFSFSPREGTVAYRLKDLPADIKKARISRLLAAAQEAETKYISRFSGKILTLLAEEYNGQYTTGYTGNYIKVYVAGQLQQGNVYSVRIISPYSDGALAELVQLPTP